MVKDLISWAAEQSTWVQDSLRRIALAVEHSVSSLDIDSIYENVRAAAAGNASSGDLVPIERAHLGSASSETRRTVLLQLGPVENVDRLAGGQKLRIAANGITLIYGENGSGKSGYTRISKRLCRSLTADQLRSNVFDSSTAPMRVEVKYKIGEDDITSLVWDPTTPPPPQLSQISVFDSQNARLYVDGENRIAYLPRELAILEHHGELCQRLAAKFNEEDKVLNSRLRIPLPAGYTPGTSTSEKLNNLDPKATTLPTEESLRQLCVLSDEENQELSRLEKDLASDPIALAAMRRKTIAVLTRVIEVFANLNVELSEIASGEVVAARNELKHAVAAEQLAARSSFEDEPFANIGDGAWRILFEAARSFATGESQKPLERLPDSTGDLCLLCLEPLTPTAAERISRFNDFVGGAAAKRADKARAVLKESLDRIEKIKIPETSVVEESLENYRNLDPKRASTVASVIGALTTFSSRRATMLESGIEPAEIPDLTDLLKFIKDDIDALEKEATTLEENAAHTEVLDAMRKRLSELKDRVKLAADLEIVLQRLKDVAEKKRVAQCINCVATRPISTQISALRRLLVTDELEHRLMEEIKV